MKGKTPILAAWRLKWDSGFEELVLAISLAFSCFLHSKQDQSVLLWWWPALWRDPVLLSWTWKWSLLTPSSTSEEALSSGWGYSYHSTPSKPPVCALETLSQKRQFLLCRTLSSKASTYRSSRPNHYFQRPGDLCLSELGGLFMHSPDQDETAEDPIWFSMWSCILRTLLLTVNTSRAWVYVKDCEPL